MNNLLRLSIALVAIAVNADSAPLPSFNKKPSPISAVIERVLRSGTEGSFGSNIAPVIGLPKSMPHKGESVVLRENGSELDARLFYVVFERPDSDASGTMTPICAYIARLTRSGTDENNRYFRVNLAGELEKVVQMQGKRGTDGKPIKGSGVKFDQDINSSEVKKAFEAEFKYWTKDWLKARKKEEAKASKAASTP